MLCGAAKRTTIGPVTTCAECGFDYEEHGPEEALTVIGDSSRAIRARLGGALARPEGLAALRHRRGPAIWSALEYAGHVRDVLLFQRERLYLALVVENPAPQPMNREDRVMLAGYNEEDPASTATEVVIAADLLCRGFRRCSSDQWARTFLAGSPQPTERRITWLAQHTAHECRHHLLDVEASLAAVQG